MTYREMIVANAFQILGTMDRLLKELDGELIRHGGRDRKLPETYGERARGGDYENLLRVTFEYGQEHLSSTLGIGPDDDFDTLYAEWREREEYA